MPPPADGGRDNDGKEYYVASDSDTDGASDSDAAGDAESDGSSTDTGDDGSGGKTEADGVAMADGYGNSNDNGDGEHADDPGLPDKSQLLAFVVGLRRAADAAVEQDLADGGPLNYKSAVLASDALLTEFLSGLYMPPVRMSSLCSLMVPGQQICQEPDCRRRGCRGNNLREEHLRSPSSSSPAFTPPMPAPAAAAAAGSVQAATVRGGRLVMEISHHKTERWHRQQPPLQLAFPPELSASVRQFIQHARPVLLQYSEQAASTAAPTPYLFLSRRGVPFAGCPVQFASVWRKVQQQYGAPWRPFPPQRLRHIHATAAYQAVVNEVAARAAPLGADAVVMGNSLRTWGTHYVHNQQGMVVQAAVDRMTAWRREELQRLAPPVPQPCSPPQPQLSSPQSRPSPRAPPPTPPLAPPPLEQQQQHPQRQPSAQRQRPSPSPRQAPLIVPALVLPHPPALQQVMRPLACDSDLRAEQPSSPSRPPPCKRQRQLSSAAKRGWREVAATAAATEGGGAVEAEEEVAAATAVCGRLASAGVVRDEVVGVAGDEGKQEEQQQEDAGGEGEEEQEGEGSEHSWATGEEGGEEEDMPEGTWEQEVPRVGVQRWAPLGGEGNVREWDERAAPAGSAGWDALDGYRSDTPDTWV